VAEPVPRCALHPGFEASHVCRICGKLLCDRCAARRITEHKVELRVCPCGGMAVPLPKQYKIARPDSLLLYPANRDGILVLLGLGLMVQLLAWMTEFPLARPLGILLEAGLVFGYLFRVLRHAADGHDLVPGPADLIEVFDIFGPGVQGLLLPILYSIPAVAYAYWTGDVFRNPGQLLSDPIFLALFLLGLLVLPLGLVSTALSRKLWPALNPLLLVQAIAAAPKEYAYALSLFWLGTTLSAGLCFVLLFAMFPLFDVPIVSFFVGALHVTASLYLPMVTARALGEYVATAGERLGYWADRTPAPPAEHDDSDPRSVTDLIAAGEQQRAVAAYYELKRRESDFGGIGPDDLLMLAGWLEQAEDFREATTNLRRVAVKFKEHPRAAESLLRCARLHHRKLAEPDNAEKLVRYLLEQFPEAAVADEARQYLEELAELGRPARPEDTF